MKLGKISNGEIILVEVEDGIEVGGTRSVAELYADGYKTACPYIGSETGESAWRDYGSCLVEEIVPAYEPEPEPEFTAEDALEIILGGE